MNTFEVYTGNNPLTYELTSAKLDAMGHIYVASLANYSFTFSYKTGRSNVEVDALSRIPWDKNITADAVQAVIRATCKGPKAVIEAHTLNVCV